MLALSAAPGGVSGQTSDAWNKLTDPNARTPAQHARTGSPPPRRCAPATGTRRSRCTPTARCVGTGAGSYATVRNRYRQQGALYVRHAHGYFVQTLSDLGWVGIGLSLLAALAWMWAAARALGDAPRATAG